MPLNRRRARRRGLSLMELAASLAMLAVAMVAAAQVLGWLAAERRASERRARAGLEAANALEQLASRPWGELTPQAVAAWSLPEAARAALPDAEARAEVADDPEVPGLKRLHVEVRWRDRASQPAPVRLTAWVARRSNGGPP